MTARFLFRFNLIFAPLAFGTVEQWSLTTMQMICLAGLLLFFIGVKQSREKACEVPGLLPLMLLPTYALVQLVPLPAGLIEIISPGAHAVYQDTIWLVEPDAWMPLSVHQKATLAQFFRFAAYAAFYVLTVQVCANPKFLKKTVAVIVVFAALLALFAIIQFLLIHTLLPEYKNTLFFSRDLTQGGTPFGSYVNRNHYAGLMEMLFPIVLAMFLYLKPRSVYGNIRLRIADISNRPEAYVYVLSGAAAVITALSIFLSLSRSGIICLAIAFISFAVLVGLKQTGHGRRPTFFLIMSLTIVSVGWFGWEPIFERFHQVHASTNFVQDGRPIRWKDSVELVKDFPITGAGFGTFQDIYPQYRTPRPGPHTTHAHNDYLELAANGGMVAAALAGWFWVVILIKSFRTFARRRDPYSIYLFVGAFTGILAIFFHSITDFNLQIGANGLYFYFLAGLLVSAANTRFKARRGVTYLMPVRFRTLGWIAALGIILTANLSMGAGSMLGQLYFNSFKDYKFSGKPPEEVLLKIKTMASRAAKVDPLEGAYSFSLGNTERLLTNDEAAFTSYKAAMRKNPCRPEFIRRMAMAVSDRGDGERAERLFQSGIRRDPGRPEVYRQYGRWLLFNGDISRGAAYLSLALSREPRMDGTIFNSYMVDMMLQGIGEEEMLRAIPKKVNFYILFAEFIEKTSGVKAAEEIYDQAMICARSDGGARAKYFHRIERFYLKRKHYEKAIEALIVAAEVLPEDTGIRMNLGNMYMKLGMAQRAMNEYEEVLAIDPLHRGAIKRLARIEK